MLSHALPSLFSDVSRASSKNLLGSSRSTTILETDLVNPESSETYVVKQELDLLSYSETETVFSLKHDNSHKYGVNELEDQWCYKLLQYSEAVISFVKQDYSPKYGVSILDQWCDKLLKYSEAVFSVKREDSPKYGVSILDLDQWCNMLLKYSEAVSSVSPDDSPKGTMQEEGDTQQKESKECVKGGQSQRGVCGWDQNCPCGRNYRTLFSGRDCFDISHSLIITIS